MPAKCHHVTLSRSQRDQLKALINVSGTSPARKLTRARVLHESRLPGRLVPLIPIRRYKKRLKVSLPNDSLRTRQTHLRFGVVLTRLP